MRRKLGTQARATARRQPVRTGTPILTRIRREQGNRDPERGGPGLEGDPGRPGLFARDKDSYREQPTCRNRPKQLPSPPPFIVLGLLALASLLYMF